MEAINLPVHIAIIMDGNRRWAKEKKLPIKLGHKEGAKTVEKIVKDNKDKPEFVQLCADKRATFVDKADKVIDLALKRMTDMLSDEEEKIPINQLAIAFGTTFDKRALAKGEMTQNVGFATNFDIEKLIDIAGYQKKEE